MTQVSVASFFGLLRLQSQFPRPIGDSSNPQTHAFEVRVRIVSDATVGRIVFDGGQALVPQFIDGANALIADGAIAIGTSCGFMAHHQDEIAKALPVPFISSALLHLNALRVAHPDTARFGIITFSEATLVSAPWFHSLAPKSTLVVGLDEDSHLYQVIKYDKAHLDASRAAAGVEQAARTLMAREPNLTAIVLECTNLGPYKNVVEGICNIPVLDYNDLMASTWRKLSPQKLQSTPS